jgi:small subunit ribosomal protein S4
LLAFVATVIVILYFSKKDKESRRDDAKIKALAETAPTKVKPKWLEYNEQDMAAKVVAMPARDDIDFDFEEQLIVELYSK